MGTFVSRKKPGPDYELIPGVGYYKFHRQAKTWNEARVTCQREGGHLVIVNSLTEAGALLHLWEPYTKMFPDWRNDWAHAGFHDQFAEGDHVTVFGK